MNLAPVDAANAHVRLRPLAPEDRGGLAALAADATLWRHWPRAVPLTGWDAQMDWQLGEIAAGRWIVHTVLTPDGAIIGQTCYLNVRPADAAVEIGGTWYAASAQGGPVNPAAKRLMLANAFAAGAERVELKTDAENARSRAAILKLGATFEGVFRRHMRRPDGTFRDTAWYSILASEWPAVRDRLDARLARLV